MTRGTEAALEPLVVNGWTIYAHPLFLQELEALAQKVEVLRKKNPKGYKQKNATKRLAAIRKLAFTDIPEDPAKAEYRQGGTLGEEYTHWFRAKFFQQYRLFFRFHAASKLLVLAWVGERRGNESARTRAIPMPIRRFARCWTKGTLPTAGAVC